MRHANAYANGDSNGYAYTDSYANGDCDRTAARFTDAASSADTAGAYRQLLLQ